MTSLILLIGTTWVEGRLDIFYDFKCVVLCMHPRHLICSSCTRVRMAYSHAGIICLFTRTVARLVMHVVSHAGADYVLFSVFGV